MINFSESSLSTRTLSLWDSNLWVILVNFSQSDYATDTPRQIDVDLMLILRQCMEKNIDNFPRHFDVFFRCNFGRRKIDVASTYFLRCNFDERKIDVILMYFVRRDFDEQNIDVVSMYYFQSDFDGWKINIVSVYILVQLRWKTDVTAHIFMWFWKAKNYGFFYISFR